MNKIKKLGSYMWDNVLYLWDNMYWLLACLFLGMGFADLYAQDMLEAIIEFNGCFTCVILYYIKTKFNEIKEYIL